MTSSPKLVVDSGVLQRNIDRMAQRGRYLGVALRPHVKTHKIPAFAQLQVDAGAQGITVATIGEAEVFAAAGFRDIFIAYPLWVDAADGRRLAKLADHATIRVGCDSLESAQALRRHSGAKLEILLEIDSGHHRSGIEPSRAGELAEAVIHNGLDVGGVFTFPGHSYNPEKRAEAAHQERQSLSIAADSLRRHDIGVSIISGGSSPSIAFGDEPGKAPTKPTEMRPGAYVFNDAQQWELGACEQSDIALTAHACVISHAGGHLILNSGSKVLGADKAPWATGHGRLLDHPDARIIQLSEHHAVVDFPGALPALGSTVRVVPNHCCNAINNADEVVDHSTGHSWKVAARGMN